MKSPRFAMVAAILCAGTLCISCQQPATPPKNPAGSPIEQPAESGSVHWQVKEIIKQKFHCLPAWSGDGNTLAFVSFDDGRNAQVWTADCAARDQRQLFSSDGLLDSESLSMVPIALQWIQKPDALMPST